MAGRKKKDMDDVRAALEEGLVTPQPAYRVETVQQDEDTELDEVFGDFPQNEACLELFRVNAQGGRPLFLEQMSPATFDFAYVAGKFGGGRYVAKGKYRDGSRKKMSFEIEGEPFPFKRKTGTLDPMAPVSPIHQPATERIIEQVGPDPQAAMLSLMRTMIQEMKTSEMAMLEKMRVYKELFGSGERRETPIDTAISMLTRGIELGQAGGEGGGIPWLAVIREVKDPLMKLADSIHAAVTGKRPVPVPQPSPVPPGQPFPSPNPEPQTEESPVLSMMKFVMPDLLMSASRGEDVETVGNRLLDQVPQSQYPMLKSWLEQPGCLDQLALMEPGIQFQRQWWSQLRATLLDLMVDGLTDADSSIQSEPDSVAPTRNPTHRGNLSA